jgi:hypothetical protein
MHCFKLLSERVMARDFDRQVAELQIRAAILNRFTALGTKKLTAWDESVQGKGKLGLRLLYATEPHDLLKIAVRDRLPTIEEDRKEDHVLRKLRALERAHRLSPYRN